MVTIAVFYKWSSSNVIVVIIIVIITGVLEIPVTEIIWIFQYDLLNLRLEYSSLLECDALFSTK
jgi:hypothetical protein